MRFEEDAWEESTLGQICTKFDYGICAEAIEFDGKNQYIRITDIDDETSQYLEGQKVSPSVIDENYIVNENDILFARTGASTGKTYLYNKKDGLLYFAGFLIRANVKDKFSAYFIYQQTKTKRYKKWIQTMSVRSGQPGINAKEYQLFKVFYPTKCIQDKISKFLSLIDQRIETQSKIIEKIKLFKNIISDHLLYSNQLSEFINLSYYATLKNGYTFKSSEYDSNGIYNVITIANVTGERYIDIVGCNKINAIPQDIQEHQQLKNNNILISLTGNVGRVSLCNKNNCLLNQRVGVLEIKNDNYNEFIFQCLSNKHFEKTMILKGQGVAQLNISKKDVENFKIPKISLDKLNQICNILNFLDKKIAIEKEIYNDYHQMKKYLLLNMFI